MSHIAQSSLEYVTTYGWALILFIAVAAVIFFVLAPDSGELRFKTDSTKFLVRSSDNDEGGFAVEIINATGRPITIDSIDHGNFEITSPQTGEIIPSGGTITITGNFPQQGVLSGGSFSIAYSGEESGLVTVAVEVEESNPQQLCPDQTCSLEENCPADSDACPELETCVSNICSGGCTAAPIASGLEDSKGENLCNETVGCDYPPCACNGSGECVNLPLTCAEAGGACTMSPCGIAEAYPPGDYDCGNLTDVLAPYCCIPNNECTDANGVCFPEGCAFTPYGSYVDGGEAECVAEHGFDWHCCQNCTDAGGVCTISSPGSLTPYPPGDAECSETWGPYCHIPGTECSDASGYCNEVGCPIEVYPLGQAQCIFENGFDFYCCLDS
ncbi:MAG: hypothetical protein JW772_04090 [Candidatus Diapherotrites archaeon]|nr:hypothetical protein [Candidatus Diapherotrites archaeon]